MHPILKIVIGSIARHWLTVAIALIGARIGWHDETAKANAVAQLSDDMLAHWIVVLFAVGIPSAFSIGKSLYNRLRLKLALLMPKHTSEKEIKALIQDAPLLERISAIATLDISNVTPDAQALRRIAGETI